MMTNPYLKAALFGSVFPSLLTAAVFTLIFFTAQGWIPLIVLVLGMYALPISLVVSLSIALWLLHGYKTWIQSMVGLMVCLICVIITMLVLQYLN